MLKKLIITGLCALSAAAVITGCGSDAKPAASSAQSAPAEKKEITVGATARTLRLLKQLPKKLKRTALRSM